MHDGTGGLLCKWGETFPKRLRTSSTVIMGGLIVSWYSLEPYIKGSFFMLQAMPFLNQDRDPESLD